MLEIKNLVKTYRPKKGVPVVALNDVSLKFGDKGLVFILGKSGSGKSTLLNLIGGLDSADSGEFIIKGKSSKDFKAADFDSYRNTFTGFIFQEYNILEEFNVGQNIALAMELQGKKATSEAVNAILDEVDLSGYGNRKPNELSGGQKQRVAIARALIKEPEIIMADEPTGALDSNTGKQVFDTLKKLAQKKLVLVVSHDREFAEYYGDRVIELADGKIISDITKYQAAPESESEGVSVVDDKILHIKEGYELTAKDLTFINEYLKKHKGETIISTDVQANSGFKRIAMIDDSGNKDSFTETTDEIVGAKKYNGAETKFVKSRLPYTKALRIGASSLKTKPIRLILTIILSFVAFALFGVADTLGSYNKIGNAVASIENNNIQTASFTKTSYPSSTWSNENIGDESLAQLREKTGLDFRGVFSGSDNKNRSISLPNRTNDNSSGGYNEYFRSVISGFLDYTQAEMEAMGYTLTGEMPTRAGEIAITKYQLESYNYYGFKNAKFQETIKKGEVLADSSDNGIIGKHLSFDYSNSEVYYGDYVITGVIDTKLDLTKYEKLHPDYKSEEGGTSMIDYMLMNELQSLVQYGMHSTLYVDATVMQGWINEIKADKANEIGKTISGSQHLSVNSPSTGGYSYNKIYNLDILSPSNVYWLNAPIATLAENQIILSAETIDQSIGQIRDIEPVTLTYWEFYSGHTYDQEVTQGQDFNNYLMRAEAYTYVNSHEVPVKFINDFQETIENMKTNFSYYGNNYSDEKVQKIAYASYLCGQMPQYGDGSKVGTGRVKNIYEAVTGNRLKYEYLFDYAKNNALLDSLVPKNQIMSIMGTASNGYRNIENVEVVGFADFGIDENNYMYYPICVADSIYDSFSQSEFGVYSYAVAPMPTDRAGIRKLVELSFDDTEGKPYYLCMQNPVMNTLSDINSMIEMLSKVFLYVGLGLAVFAALLLTNFISVSIANKKREIGILRAVGARSSDVFTIFFNESIIIALINFVLALIGTIVATVVLNNVFAQQLGLTITLLNFGIRQIALMLGVSVGVAIIASFLPVYFLAKKRPIEAIRGR